MSGVLAIVALTVLVALALLSLKRQRESVAVERQRAMARSHVGEAQHDRSLSRLESVRSAPEAREAPADELRSGTGASGTGSETVG